MMEVPSKGMRMVPRVFSLAEEKKRTKPSNNNEAVRTIDRKSC